jgi:cobalt-zinc-cadmium efflux system protein
LDELVTTLHTIAGVADVHHIHVREMDELHRTLEAHVVVELPHLANWPAIKRAIKVLLAEQFNIHHSTLEFESPDEAACEECPPVRRPN